MNSKRSTRSALKLNLMQLSPELDPPEFEYARWRQRFLFTIGQAQRKVQRYLRMYKPPYSDHHNRVNCEHVNDFYVNASEMRSVLDNKMYAIFAQAPVKKVVDHFWLACYHYSVKKIIMLCSFEDPYRGVAIQLFRNRLKNIGPRLDKRCIFNLSR